MTKLIFVTGFRGSGKTHASEAWAAATNSLLISGDRLFSTSLKLIRPELTNEESNDWDKWPSSQRTADFARGVLKSTIHSATFALDKDQQKYPANLEVNEKDILVEGAIFANDWFRNATHDVLVGLGHAFDGANFLYSNPPNDVIFGRIHSRGRPDEIDVFRDLATVIRQNNEFRTCFGVSRLVWTEFTTSESLNAEFERLLRKCP